VRIILFDDVLHCESKNWATFFTVTLANIGRFLPVRRYASAGYSDRNVSVCPSVHLSRAGIVSKRRKLAS